MDRPLDLEGIVSKKRTAPYVAGSKSGWFKVKTTEWREANRGAMRGSW